MVVAMKTMTRQESLAKAHAGARRKKEIRLARELAGRGWVSFSPYDDEPITEEQIAAAQRLLARAGWEAKPVGGVE